MWVEKTGLNLDRLAWLRTWLGVCVVNVWWTMIMTWQYSKGLQLVASNVLGYKIQLFWRTIFTNISTTRGQQVLYQLGNVPESLKQYEKMVQRKAIMVKRVWDDPASKSMWKISDLWACDSGKTCTLCGWKDSKCVTWGQWTWIGSMYTVIVCIVVSCNVTVIFHILKTTKQ